MNKETFVAFATQKGGVGKSTVTALVANYVHNVMGYNVAVIDCDEPQHSIAGLRDKETALIEQNDRMRAIACEHFRKSGRKAFPVIRSNAVQALDDAESLLAEGDYKPDIGFFDLPGTLKSDGVIKSLSQMDYILTPSSADRFVVESALQFVMMFNDNLVTTGIARTKAISLFWTKVDGRRKTVCRKQLPCTRHQVAGQQALPPGYVRRPQDGVPLDHPACGQRHAAGKPHQGTCRRNLRCH